MTLFGISAGPDRRARKTRATRPVGAIEAADARGATETAVFALALEPRYLFDAAGLATAAEAAEPPPEPSREPSPEPSQDSGETGAAGGEAGTGPGAPQAAADPAMDAALAAYQPPDQTVPGESAAGARTEIAFIDGSVGGYEALLDSLPDGVEAIVLDGTTDALHQIAEALDGRTDIDAIHIVSHGEVGALTFGAGTVDAANLADHAGDLAAIGAALAVDGDILLYGCYVGADGAGQTFLDALADATGADIAASEDLTGADARDGDWVLEARTGAIGETAVDDAFAASGFAGVLIPASSAPVISNLNGDLVTAPFGSFRVNTLLDAGGDAVVTDSDSSNFDGGKLTVALIAGAHPTKDYIGLAAEGGGVTWPDGSQAGDRILVDGVEVATFDANGAIATSSRTVNLNANADAAAVSKLVQALGFTTLGTATAGDRTVRITLTDGDGGTSIDHDVTVRVSEPNTAPQLGGTAPDATATEDVATAIDLSAYNISDAQDDTITLTLAVNRGTIASVDGNGTTAGVTIAESGTVSMTLQGSAANLNTYLNDTSKITFTTGANETSSATLTVTPNDGTVDGTPDTVAITITAVNDAPVLEASASPVLGGIAEDAGDDDGSGADGDDDATNNANNPGTSIADLVVNGSITDPDITAGEAIAVTAVDNTNGVWQYSTDKGTTWTNFSGTTGTSVDLSGAARLLDGALLDGGLSGDNIHLVRFVPDADYSGTATLTFRAWDRSSGSAGGTADTSTNGGASAFSAATNTASITVSAVNDAPVLTGLDGTPTFTEGQAGAVRLDSDVTVSDQELAALNGGNGDFAGASLTIARNGGADAADFFFFDLSGASFTIFGSLLRSGGSTFGDFSSSGGTLTINFTSSGTAATTALVSEVLQRITYQNNSDDPPANAQLDWSFGDGNSGTQGSGGAGTATGAVTVTITGVDDAPTLTATGSDPTFTEGAAAADLFSSVSASTVEASQTVASMTLTVTNVADGANEILRVDGSDIQLTHGFSVAGTATNGLTVGVSVAGSTATVSFSGATLSAAALQTLVDGLTYRNASDDPTTAANRVVTITELVDSGTNTGDNANTAALTIVSTVTVVPVNDPPAIGGVDGDSSDVMAAAGVQGVGVFDDATVSNADSADYNGGFLTLVQGSGTANGTWGLNDTAATAGGDATIAAGETIAVGGVTIGTVSATDDGQGGNALRIDFSTADATSARIQALLRALTYEASSGLGDRGFTLTLNDADGTANGGDPDATAGFTVKITPNPPVVGNLDGDSVTAANGGTVAIDQGAAVTVTDADSTNFNGGNLSVSRTSGLSGDFSLNTGLATSVTAGGDGTFVFSDRIAVGGVEIGRVFGPGQGTGPLVIIFDTVDATPARVADFIRALQYTSTDAGAHSFDLAITDAGSGATSTAAGFTVQVEASPVNTVPGAQAAVDGQALAITGISVADADSATVTTTVSVAGGSGTFTASGAAAVTGGGTNTLQIAGSLAAVNATLANLQYTPAVGSSGAQTVTVLTSDGTNTDSDSFTVTVNDRPDIANLAGDSRTVTPGSTNPLDLGGDAAVSDADTAAFAGGVLTVTRVDPMLEGDFSLDGTAATAGGDATLAAAETISVGGTDIGTVTTAGQGADNLVIALNANATPALVGTLLQTLRYTSTAIGTHSFDVTVSDGAGGATSEAARAGLVVETPPADTIEAVILRTDDGGEALAVETPVGPLVLVTTPVQVSGDAVADIFNAAAETGNSPISRAFFGAVNANNITPIALAFEAAMTDSGVRSFLASAVGEGRSIYVFDGGDWQLLDVSTLGTADGPMADGETGAQAGLSAGPEAAPAAVDLAGPAAVLGADQLAALPVLGGDGAESFSHQIAEAASGFEREAAQLAAALASATAPATSAPPAGDGA